MSIKHLQILKNELLSSQWAINKELSGDELRISGYWEISRPNGDFPFVITFDGLDDLEVYPMEKAYGCHVVGSDDLGLYFGKVEKSFKSEVLIFIDRLNELNT